MNPKLPRHPPRQSRRRFLQAAGLAPAWAFVVPPRSWTLEEDFGATAASESSVRRAVAWLRKAQNRDGSCGVDWAQSGDIGCTALFGLALMATGSTCLEGECQQPLRESLRFVLRCVDQMPPTNITSVDGTQLQNKIGRQAHTFFAALFLSQVLGEHADPLPAKRALKRLVDVMVSTQTPDGDWGNDSWAPTLGTVMGWVSLRAADAVGIDVQGAPEKTAQLLIRRMDQGALEQQGWMHELYKNASGIRVLFDMEMETHRVAQQAFAAVLELIRRDKTPFTQAGGEEFLAFHLITETMLKRSGEHWDEWFPIVRDKLIDVQNADGSWSGHHCITSRTFCTAAALLVLTSPYRYLPVSQA